jgi:POT family proton-dependent oligopeptide transporter
VGNKLAGWVAGFFDQLPLPDLFGRVALVAIAVSVVLLALTPQIRKLMGGVR